MSFNLSAGVYTREVNQSNVIAGVGDSVGAIVIQANQGIADERVLVTNNKQFVDTFGEPSNLSMLSALAFLGSANRLYVVRKTLDATAATINVDDSGAGVTFAMTARGGGVYGNDISYTLAATGDADIFELVIFYKAVEVETFNISKTVGKVDGFGKSVYMEQAVNDVSAYVVIADTTANTNNPAVVGTATSLAGGSDDTAAPATNDIIAGYDLFLVRDEVEVSLLINAGWAEPSIKTNMVSIAEARKDCIALLDTTYNDTIGAMVTEAGTINSTYAAMYGPWIYAYDQYHDTYNYLPPSGYVAGSFASTALNDEVWYAVAGSRRGVLNVSGVEFTLTEGERDLLYAANVNPIQQFFGDGIQIYGQKTLTSTPSALDRINVRMLMIKISKAMNVSLKPFVFEINDSFMRDNITSIISNYLEDIKVRRGLTDFGVVCDTTNNTPVVIDQNKLIIDIYIKPSRVAEFIRVNAIVTASGISLS